MTWHLYELDGKDGIDLLHRISTHDFRLPQHLPQKEWQAALFLNSSGKIIATFEAKRISENKVYIRIPTSKQDQALKSFLETLETYTFAEKYTLRENGADESTPFSSILERIKNKIPQVDFEYTTDGKTSPLDIGMHYAIADQKGCYPGQEIIEKIVAIGDAPKRLKIVQISAPTDFENQQTLPLAISVGDRVIGHVTSISKNADLGDGHWLGLAILSKTHAKPNMKFTLTNKIEIEVME